ncbi:MAG: electron transfer flavoprotein subunit alpha, partial [Oscillospiraceae bacterium]
MEMLKIHGGLVTKEAAENLVEICPFGAISYESGKLDISSGCKMCRLCIKKGPAGVITLETAEESVKIDKDLWRGIAVFVEHRGGVIHNVTKELIGKAIELSRVIGHP